MNTPEIRPIQEKVDPSKVREEQLKTWEAMWTDENNRLPAKPTKEIKR